MTPDHLCVPIRQAGRYGTLGTFPVVLIVSAGVAKPPRNSIPTETPPTPPRLEGWLETPFSGYLSSLPRTPEPETAPDSGPFSPTVLHPEPQKQSGKCSPGSHGSRVVLAPVLTALLVDSVGRTIVNLQTLCKSLIANTLQVGCHSTVTDSEGRKCGSKC